MITRSRTSNHMAPLFPQKTFKFKDTFLSISFPKIILPFPSCFVATSSAPILLWVKRRVKSTELTIDKTCLKFFFWLGQTVFSLLEICFIINAPPFLARLASEPCGSSKDTSAKTTRTQVNFMPN